MIGQLLGFFRMEWLLNMKQLNTDEVFAIAMSAVLGGIALVFMYLWYRKNCEVTKLRKENRHLRHAIQSEKTPLPIHRSQH